MQSRSAVLIASLFAIAVATLSCGDGSSPTAPNPVTTCTFVVTPGSASVPAAGGTTTAHVDTTSSCSWTTRVDASWISLNPAAGTGSADIVVTVRGNDASEQRSAQIAIADKTVSVRQDGRTAVSCEYALDPESQTFAADAGRGRITVQTGETCSWTARALDGWLTIRTLSGTGPGVIEYEFPAYTGTEQRQTRIMVGDRSAIVRQDPPAREACSYTVDPTSARFHWHGGELSVNLTTGARCRWTAASEASWIGLPTPVSGEGSTVVKVHTETYTDDNTRSAPVAIRWPTETAGQNVWISQEGCRYAITGDKVKTFPAAGGQEYAYVIEQAISPECNIPCPWTAEPDVAWIRILSGSPGAGYDRFRYEVLANTTGASRSGAITVMGHRLTIVQTP